MTRISEEISTASFTDQKPHIATADDLKRPWGGAKNGDRFRCYMCGQRFAEGDYYRWVYTNSTPGASGNPMVCETCDGPDVVERWAAMWREAYGRFWWFSINDPA